MDICTFGLLIEIGLEVWKMLKKLLKSAPDPLMRFKLTKRKGLFHSSTTVIEIFSQPKQ